MRIIRDKKATLLESVMFGSAFRITVAPYMWKHNDVYTPAGFKHKLEEQLWILSPEEFRAIKDPTAKWKGCLALTGINLATGKAMPFPRACEVEVVDAEIVVK
jgi:hypothetical protein